MVAIFILGFALGFIVCPCLIEDKAVLVGRFEINKTNPGEDLLMVDFDMDIDKFEDEDYIKFKVERT
jgi:hypothetical protein